MLKSLYVEVDRFEGASSAAPPASTARECYLGAQESLKDAIENRRIAYDRLSRWKCEMGNQGTLSQHAKAKRRDMDEHTRAVFDDYGVLDGDRCRSEKEVEHWRGLIEWWRQRDALGLDRVYGSSIRALADGAAMAPGGGA